MHHGRCKTYITNAEKTAPTEFRVSWGLRQLGALKFEVAPAHDLLKQDKSSSLEALHLRRTKKGCGDVVPRSLVWQKKRAAAGVRSVRGSLVVKFTYSVHTPWTDRA